MKTLMSLVVIVALFCGSVGLSARPIPRKTRIQTPDEACMAAIEQAQADYAERLGESAATALRLKMYDRVYEIVKLIGPFDPELATTIREAASDAEIADAQAAGGGGIVGRNWQIFSEHQGWVLHCRLNGRVTDNGRFLGMWERRGDGGYDIVYAAEPTMHLTVYINGDRMTGTLHCPKHPHRDGERVTGGVPQDINE